MKKSGGFAEILSEVNSRRKFSLASKVPSWGAVEGLEIPSGLCLEQCSSELTALYKASLAPWGSIADLNSGLGVDVWAFSQKAEKVWYNELDPTLAAAAKGNFEKLGLKNVECSCADAAQRLSELGNVDMIFLDPARRDNAGRKVFLLEDCSPDVLEMMPELWKHSDTIMLKLSPMADISMLEKRLEGLSEVHIVGAGGECKELLCILKKGHLQGCRLIAAELSAQKTATVELGEGAAELINSAPEEGDYLLEASASLLKSGKYGAICRIFGLKQLDSFTHLYIRKNLPVRDSAFFKTFRILENAPFSKAGMKRIGALHPDADVTARNLPLSSEELKKKMGISSSGGAHIFGASVLGERRLLVCEKVTGPESVV